MLKLVTSNKLCVTSHREETHKVDVIKFSQNKGLECARNNDLLDKDSAALLWDFIVLLCRQNGVRLVVGGGTRLLNYIRFIVCITDALKDNKNINMVYTSQIQIWTLKPVSQLFFIIPF